MASWKKHKVMPPNNKKLKGQVKGQSINNLFRHTQLNP